MAKEGGIEHPDLEDPNDPQQDPEPEPEPEPEAASDLAGYPDVPHLVDGYRASSTEAKRLFSENRQLREQLTQVIPLALKAVPGSVTQAPEDPYTKMTELGIPVDAVRQVISQEVQSALAPIAQGFQARARVMSEHADFPQHESEVSRYLSENPEMQAEYNRTFNHNPAMAMEWAFMKYKNARPNGETRQPKTRVLHDKELKGSEIPRGAPSGGKREVEDQTHTNKLKEAWEYGQKYGEWGPYTKLRLRNLIPDSHFQ